MASEKLYRNTLRQYTGFKNCGPLLRTNSYIEHAWIGTESWGFFLEIPVAFRARKAMPYFVQDQSFNSFDNDAIKISVNDAKYTHYELGTVLLFNKF